MSRRCLERFVIIAVLFFGFWLWLRAKDRVIAEAAGPSGWEVIRVREVQIGAASLHGIFRLSHKIYRCEYYPNSKWPMFSCVTFEGDSYEVRKAEIKWLDSRRAEVILDGVVHFECSGGDWHTRP